ncbi:MAG: hypothetical protein KAX19_00700, partial [Candidatus Brocadiae bacterium]|nr:hypothetical protein [Candidatus Brocadiia bacterium]
ITHGVGKVVFPLSCPSLAVEDASWVLLRTSRFVGSRQAGEASPAMVAARTLGRGRVLVFAAVPLLEGSAWQDSPLHGNDAGTALLNGLLWASQPIRWPQAEAQ